MDCRLRAEEQWYVDGRPQQGVTSPEGKRRSRRASDAHLHEFAIATFMHVYRTIFFFTPVWKSILCSVLRNRTPVQLTIREKTFRAQLTVLENFSPTVCESRVSVPSNGARKRTFHASLMKNTVRYKGIMRRLGSHDVFSGQPNNTVSCFRQIKGYYLIF